MPRIPLMNTQVNSPNVPDLGQGPSVARAGQTWDAVAKVGAGIADAAGDIAMMRKEAELNSFMASSKAELDRATAEKEKELDAKYQGKDPTGYASEMNEFLNQIGTDIMDRAPRDSVREVFSNRFAEISNNIGMNAQAKEDRNRAYYQSGLIEESSRKDRAFLIANPSAEKASSFYANTLEAIKGGTGLFFDPETANKMLKREAANYGEAYLEGAIQNKRFGEVIRFADGKDPNGKVLHENLDPGILQKYKGEALRKMESENELSKRVLGKQLEDIKVGAFSGLQIPAETIGAVKAKLNQLPADERAYAMDDLNNALSYGDKLRQAKSMKINEIQNAASLMIDHGDDIFNRSGRMQAQKMFENGLKEIINNKQNNYPEFIVGEDNDFKLKSKEALNLNDPQAMRDWAVSVEAKQKQEGASQVKVLTKEMSKSYGAMLKAKNPEAVNQVRDALANGFSNEYFGKVVAEMVANKDIDQDMALSLYMPEPELRKKFIQNIQQKAEINESWGTRATKEAKDTMKEMFEDPEILSIKKAILAGDRGNSRLWLNNSLESSMELHYKAAIKGGSTPKEAREQAMQIITGSFTGASAGRSQIIVPKQFEGFKSNIEDYMEASLTEPSLRVMDLSIPKEYLDAPELIGKDQEEIKSKYLADISKSGKWISNPTQTGAILTKVNKFGEVAPVRDSQGKIIERSFHEMRDNGMMYDEEIKGYQAIIDANKEEAKTSVSAAGKIAMAQYNISNLRREQKKRKF